MPQGQGHEMEVRYNGCGHWSGLDILVKVSAYREDMSHSYRIKCRPIPTGTIPFFLRPHSMLAVMRYCCTYFSCTYHTGTREVTPVSPEWNERLISKSFLHSEPIGSIHLVYAFLRNYSYSSSTVRVLLPYCLPYMTSV